ncbi:MAG TPA: class I SAM-dependent methyltransferase [Phycisphaerae bacterium]|nr:class I SAM-dependent methyltransferase [Phycisphaerae bacterium]
MTRLAVCPVLLSWLLGLACLAGEQGPDEAATGAANASLRILADKRLQEPLRAIVEAYGRRTGARIELSLTSMTHVHALVGKKETGCDVVLSMPAEVKSATPVSSLPGAKNVAWKYPSMEPVWAAAVTGHPHADAFVGFAGGPTGHRLWSESKAGFTITTGKTHAEAFEWVAEHRVKHTYPLTAMRMLAEFGGIRDGVCIDVGCGPGNLDVELAKRSNFTIIGLDIDPDMKPLFEKRAREAGLGDRLSFVVGDAQKMPFPDDHADVIVSRGTLVFIPDIAKCLQETARVLKPTGVAFLGGRYVYTPQKHKISTEKLEQIVRESGVAGAKVIDARGQWVKIIGPQAPKAAQTFQGGPHMLADRFVADYAVTDGDCLVICGGDGGLEQGLQKGLVDVTNVKIIALYPSEKVARQAEERIRKAGHAERIACKVGAIGALPFDEASFDLVAGVGPMLVFAKDKAGAMREVYRVLRTGGAALVGGKFLGMPDHRKVSSETLRASAAATGIPSIRVYDDMGQWVEIRKGILDRGFRD